MFILISSFVLGILGHYTALLSVAKAIINTKTYTEYIRYIQANVYALITVAVSLWMIFDIKLFLAYGIAYMITLCLIDYENTYDEFLKD